MKDLKDIARKVAQNERTWSPKKELNETVLANYLPHGSGVDSDWHIEDKGSYYRADCSYHCMDEMGYYDGWVDFYLTIPKKKPTDFKIHFSGDQYRVRKYSLRDYLSDTIGYALDDLERDIKSAKISTTSKTVKPWYLGERW